MENRILLLSDFNEKTWSFESALKQSTGAQVLWLTAKGGNRHTIPFKHVDLAVIDVDQFDLQFLMNIGVQTPVILLVDSAENIHGQIESSPQTIVLEKNCDPKHLIAAVESLVEFKVIEPRRQYVRMPGKHEAVLQSWHSNEISPGRVMDISLGGVKLQVQGYRGQIDDLVTIQIHDPSSQGGELMGRVVWIQDAPESEQYLMGVRFLTANDFNPPMS